jgi:folate-binding protein YgfZ
MANDPQYARLPNRAVIDVAGPDWRDFLQGLLTQDVSTLAPGEIRFSALLTPQGRLLFDLFVVGGRNGCRLDCAVEQRQGLIERLTLYRLRAKVEIAASEAAVNGLWNATSAPEGWAPDPRLPDLGYRGFDKPCPPGAQRADLAAWNANRLALGVPASDDWGVDATYPIEADFDLLNGVDFKKGCFVGQETTSRMKRRGAVKSRMTPITFEGAPPEPGSELLAGAMRCGKVLSGLDGIAIALIRLDRAELEPRLTSDGRPWNPSWPHWLVGAGANQSQRSQGHS